MARPPVSLIEFPADDLERARRFWSGVLGVELEQRRADQGEGWQTNAGSADLGLHHRGRGPGDTLSLPYFEVEELAGALERARALGGSVIHSGQRWAVCRDSEGSPFGLAVSAAEPVEEPGSPT